MRKLAFCIYAKTKTQISFAVTDREADQKLVFATRIVQSSTSQILNFKLLAILCGCTARFVSDLVGNPEDPEDRFSHNKAHVVKLGFTGVFIFFFYLL